jgi:hypothetical protein
MQGWYWWIVILAFSWPLVHLAVFVARFGGLPPGGLGDGLVFFPMGLVSASVLALFVWLARTPAWRTCTVAGYLIVSPCAFVGSLMSGLIYPQPTGTLLYGAIPLILGTVGGYLVGRLWRA